MKPTTVTDGIYRLSLNVKDLLFEQLWEIPNGVTLNSYIVKGDKTAIVDGVCGWDGIPEKLYELFDQLGITAQDVDYVIINHMEPDHSGWIESFKRIRPDVQIYCTHMAAGLLRDFFGITAGVNVIKSDDVLDLGAGKKLQFIQQPGVHWPDTMMTYELTSETLMPCDMFGSFGVCQDNHYDDEFTDADLAYFWHEQIRYFSNVLVTFNPAVKKAVEKTLQLQPSIIAPGHGPVYRQHPRTIIDNYQKITGMPMGDALPEVTLLWGSMYGMTERAVHYIEQILRDYHISFNSLQLPQASLGDIMTHTLRAQYLIIAAPTYENNLFPPVISVLDELGRKKIRHKQAIYVGSYGWSGGGRQDIERIIAQHNMDWQLCDAVSFKGSATTEDLIKITDAVLTLVQKIR